MEEQAVILQVEVEGGVEVEVMEETGERVSTDTISMGQIIPADGKVPFVQ